jgi:hypothetical protein
MTIDSPNGDAMRTSLASPTQNSCIDRYDRHSVIRSIERLQANSALNSKHRSIFFAKPERYRGNLW